MMKIPILTAILSLCVPAFAAPLPPLPAKSLGVKAAVEASVNFRISFKIKDGELEDAGSFVVLSGSQSNCIAAAKPSSAIVRADCQFEISGPLSPVGELKARPAATFQFQTSFEVERGHAIVLVDGPVRHIEVKIEAVAP